MTRNTGEKHDSLALDIRRQFGERSTARFLHALPAFKVVNDIPRHLRALLDKLEETESGAKGKTTSQ
jgi:hypothetical protein